MPPTRQPNKPSQHCNSKVVESNQPGVHDKLQAVVLRHLSHTFKKPFAEHNQRAFEQAQHILQHHSGPLIFDSFCGVGESTVNIARRHPEAWVLGIDKSGHRLDKHALEYLDTSVENYSLIQADVDDFWRLAVADGWQLDRHFLLYPNPWPKTAHLQRRVHGSAVFPSLLALGGTLELRSNWRIYVEEFSLAVQFAGREGLCSPFEPEDCITPFERKYQQSGQALWRCMVNL